MATTFITGSRGTLSVDQGTRRIDIGDRIIEKQPDVAPLTYLTSHIGSKPAVDPLFSWYESDLEPRFDSTTGTATNSVTTIPVTNGPYFAEHDIVYVPRTGESFRVLAVASNNLSVVRGVGSTAAAMNSGEELLITGSAQPEGDTSKPARSVNPTKVSNYTQIFRTDWEATGTNRASLSQLSGENDWAWVAKHKEWEHARSIEYAYLVGNPSESTAGSQPRRTTGGARHFITTNVTDAGGTLSEAELWGFVKTAFRFGSQTKTLLASGTVVSVLNSLAMSHIQTRQGDNTFGLKVMQYLSPFGTVNVALDYTLEGTTLGGEAFLLDLDMIRKRTLNNNGEDRNTHLRPNIQQPDADGRKDELLTETGLEFGIESAHARLTNVTG